MDGSRGGAGAAADGGRGGAAAAAGAGHVARGGGARGAAPALRRRAPAARHQPVADRLPVSIAQSSAPCTRVCVRMSVSYPYYALI